MGVGTTMAYSTAWAPPVFCASLYNCGDYLCEEQAKNNRIEKSTKKVVFVANRWCYYDVSNYLTSFIPYIQGVQNFL